MQDKRSAKEIKALKALYAKARDHDSKGQLAEAARSYRFFLSQWPDPVAYYNYGVVLKKLQRFDEALQSYQKATALQPDYAQAYVNMGTLYYEQREFKLALAQYDKAIACNPLLVAAYYNRGVALQEFGRLEDAVADYDHALAIDKNYYLAYLNKSVILYELKKKAAAARNYEDILRINPEHLDSRWNLGVLKLSEGDFADGWRLYEARRKLQRDDYNKILQKPYWLGREDIRGKTMFLKWEQGFGDTIQFCRYAKLVRQAGANTILSVQAPLRRLMQSLDAEIQIIGEDEVPDDYDYHTRLMSLPHAFATVLESIPQRTKYLHIAAEKILPWRARLQPRCGLKLGLVWAGGDRPDIICARRNDANRSMNLAQFAPLLGVRGIQFVSLQKGPPASQLAESAYDIHDWTDELTDFADTGALIEALDLVITVDTAVAHLAAALGKTVWILIPFVSCWRWLEDRTDSPWYASVRLFRQTERGNWESVLSQVRQALTTMADHMRGPNPAPGTKPD